MSGGRLNNLFVRILAHPLLYIFLVALAVRLVVAVISNTVQESVLIPDEMSYIRIADLVSTGDLSPVPTQRCLDFAIADGTQYYCGYWRGLFASTRTFSWPLTTLFWLFGPYRILGQALAGLAGAAAAAVTGRYAMEILREPFGVGAGFVVAFLPSQVLFSSVVLRESTIWLLLASLGVAVLISRKQVSPFGLVLSSLGIGVVFVLLAWLRLQTAVLALWCAAPVFAMVGRNRVLRVLCAAGVVLIGPMLVGAGPAASGFVGGSIERLGYSRDVMSSGAVTAFDYTSGSGGVGELSGSGGVGELSGSEGAPVGVLSIVERDVMSSGAVTAFDYTSGSGGVGELSGSGGVGELSGSEGAPVGVLSIVERDVEDESLVDSVLLLPSGLYNTMIRPVFWSKADLSSVSAGHLLATLESPFWIVGYLFAGFGAYSLRRRMSLVAFPVLFLLAVAFSGAVSHGNLGTAFRHRGQVVFGLVVLAAAGVQAVVDGRRVPRGHDGGNWVRQLDGVS